MNLKRRCFLFIVALMLPVSASAALINHNRSERIERIQLLPFGGPTFPGPQCTPQYQALLKLQLDGLQRLQGLTRVEGERLCAALEDANQQGVDKLLNPKSLLPLLKPEQREFLDALGVDVSKIDVAKLMRLLGVDLSKIDLRRVKEQCRQSQGVLGQFATNALGRLENEIIRCDDRI